MPFKCHCSECEQAAVSSLTREELDAELMRELCRSFRNLSDKRRKEVLLSMQNDYAHKQTARRMSVLAEWHARWKLSNLADRQWLQEYRQEQQEERALSAVTET